MKKRVLIASCSFDTDAVSPVVNRLKARGYECLVYESDKVVSGKASFDLSIKSSGGATFSYEGKTYDPEGIDAAWHRRPGLLGLEIPDKGKQLSLSYEMRSLQDGLWRLIPDAKWLNSPAVMKAVDNKLLHLTLAREVGFTIPDTVVSNTWTTIQSKLPPDIIMKLPRGLMYINNQARSTATTALRNTSEGLPLQSSPFPGIFQPRIRKSREWRITVVGDRTFDASIYSDLDTDMLDWRTHQFTPAVRFEAETFPQEHQQRCIEFLHRLGLRYGAFDFIENDAGITFLECNLNGQYLWLEEDLGLPISEAIADELAAIAG